MPWASIPRCSTVPRKLSHEGVQLFRRLSAALLRRPRSRGAPLRAAQMGARPDRHGPSRVASPALRSLAVRLHHCRGDARPARLGVSLMRVLLGSVRVLVTLAVLAVAVVAGAVLWDYYVYSPWTRDGRVRAEVVGIAPEVAGRITALQVADNQFVHKGDLLFTI